MSYSPQSQDVDEHSDSRLLVMTTEPSEQPSSLADSKRRTPTRWLIGAGVLLALIGISLVAFRGAGRWLIRQDPLSPAGATVVLSGGTPYRAEEAAKLYGVGYAPEVWVSRATNSASEFQKLGIQFIPDDDYDREALVRLGVPAAAIHILPDAIVNTEEEVREISREMQRQGKTNVIIVTSPQHTRRVRALWTKLVAGDQKATIRAAFEDPFDADHWWRNSRDALSVTREILGLMNAWTGLPVRPHTS